jgi:hypothetical protein
MRFDDLSAFVWRGKSAHSVTAAIPTGFGALDRVLPGGGWPQRAITEIYLDRYGIGELALLIPALSWLTRSDQAVEKKWILFVAPPFIPYAPALLQHGIAVERVLLVHPSSAAKECLWAVEQAVRSGSSVAVLAWVAAADGVALRRLQIAAESQCCWTVLFRPSSALEERSPAALRVRLSVEESASRLEIVKCRGGRPAVVDLHGNDPGDWREPKLW